MTIEEIPNTMKLCSRCEHIKIKDDFYTSKISKDGLSSICRRCEKDRKRKEREDDPELVLKHRIRNNIWYSNNKEKKQIQNKEWRLNNPAKYREMNLLRRFGISLEEYNNILTKQDFKCKICKTHYDEIDYEMSVDHCHKTGKIRGLLCRHCNTGLGHFKDDINLLKEAINYLRLNKNE